VQDSATTPMLFETPTPLALQAAFDGGRITSDGGLCWLAEVDRALGLCEAVARHVPEWRGPSVRHSLLRLVRQRVYQVACGYEDQNDSDTLRSEPLLKLVLGSLPETGTDLASQPTISRLENTPDAKACACASPGSSASSTSGNGAKMATPNGCYSTSTQQTILPMATKKAPTTTATTRPTSTTLWLSLTVRQTSSSLRS
jgi:hypothetical protein